MPSISYKCICCGSNRLLKSQSILSPFFAYKMFDYIPLKIKKKFQDIKSGYSYYLCQSIECKNCGLVFLDQRFTNKELDKYYNDYQSKKFFYDRMKFEKSFIPRFKKIKSYGIIAGEFKFLSKIESFILKKISLPKKILDYGAGDGKGTVFCKNPNVRIFLFDLFNFNKNRLTKSKVTIKNRNFDLITLRHVLEHVSYPKEILLKLNKAVSKKTKIYIEVPKEKLISNFKKGNRYNNKIIWTEHINIFTKESLKRLVEHSKFKVLDIKDLIINKGNVGKTDNDREHIMLLAEKK